MIRYALKCSKDHGFESWFRSAADFESLAAARQLECPSCGDRTVSKALMAPRVTASDRAGDTQIEAKPQPAETMAAGTAMPEEVRAAIEKLRSEVEAHSDYVGRSFAQEARAIHEGEKPSRAIHGEANAEEARALLQDGIPVLPLPFRDRRGTN
ncbi:DUF1178 family protein [Mangrovicoccus sp. HB161399]|uniref:DUF1178 family protein n=1 Tax=Mangrovicoccus sp. HB161399 TaxID=2720392 RepID=UPI001553C82A|nr:DUF1178 family protein [Mangrovicoccus sp. HB161399]